MQLKPRQWRRKIERIRHPILRIIIGVALLAGGVLWFLPILGIWMVPLGIAVLAIDIPWMRPVNQAMRRFIQRGVEAMQRSSIGWVSKLGSKLDQPVTLRRRKRSTDDSKSNDQKSDNSATKKVADKNASDSHNHNL